MKPRRLALTLSLIATVLAAVALIAYATRCQCVLGGNFNAAFDPADCAKHGAGFQE